jgi:hypothetical protein
MPRGIIIFYLVISIFYKKTARFGIEMRRKILPEPAEELEKNTRRRSAGGSKSSKKGEFS